MELWRQLTAESLPELNFGATNLKRATLQSSRPCDREEKEQLVARAGVIEQQCRVPVIRV
jgi:hypothetical protein